MLRQPFCKRNSKQVKWEKPSDSLIKAFDEALPKTTRVEKRKMFGMPAAFVNGNMFAGLHNQNILLRLPEKDRATLLKSGWAQFEPMAGRPMKEYLASPADIKAAELKKWLNASYDFVAAKPAKVKKAKD